MPFLISLIIQHNSNCLYALYARLCAVSMCCDVSFRPQLQFFPFDFCNRPKRENVTAISSIPAEEGLSCSTHLMFPQQEGHKASVDAALDYEDHVGGFRRLRHHQKFACRESLAVVVEI